MTETALERLSDQPDVTILDLRAGQVLYYRDHVPPGVFVLRSGVVEALETEDGPPALSSMAGNGHLPVLLPEPGRLDDRSPATVRAASAATAVFIPRSLIARDPKLREVLERLAARGDSAATGRVP